MQNTGQKKSSDGHENKVCLKLHYWGKQLKKTLLKCHKELQRDKALSLH